MGIKTYKPYTPSRRNMTGSDFSEITKTTPEKSLVVSLKKNSGRNNQGKITVRHRGGGSRRKYRIIDFKRNKKDGIPAVVTGIEYDPNRTANIALITYADGEKAYILAPQGLKDGMKVMSLSLLHILDYVERFQEHDVSYVSGRNIIIPNKNTGSRHFGLFELADFTHHNLAMPVIHWGKFYEQMIKNIMEGNWKNSEGTGAKSLNYWWGMSSGLVDVICSDSLPRGTERLIELLKKTICEGEFNPFSGVLYSQNGIIQEDKEKTLTPEKIITMDWLCDNVIGRIPKMSERTEHARPIVMEQGIGGEIK